MHLKMIKHYFSIVIILVSFTFNAYCSKNRFKGDVFVDISAKNIIYKKVAVLPFKAPIELAGSSVSDFLTTKLLQSYKYEMVERGQIENILKEQTLNSSDVTEDSLAIKLGALLGVQGSIIGTISEYGYQQEKDRRLPSVGLSIRMIDTTSGKIVWSVSDSQIGSHKVSLSQHAKMMVKNMVAALLSKFREIGDLTATALPTPKLLSTRAGIRTAMLEWEKNSNSLISAYAILRSQQREGPYKLINKTQNKGSLVIQFIDDKLLDSSVYYYKIQGISKDNLLTMPSEPMEIITAGPPRSPDKVSAKPDGFRKIIVSWQAIHNPDIKGYCIYRKKNNNEFKKIGYVNQASSSLYSDNGSKKEPLKDNQIYAYAICSVNKVDVKSKLSKTAQTKTIPLPSMVTNLVSKSNLVKSVVLKWDQSLEEYLEGYCVYRSTSLDGEFKIIKSRNGRENTTYLDKASNKKALKDGYTYYYQIAGYYQKDGIGKPSQTVSATTKPLPVKVHGFKANSQEIKQISLSWELNTETDISKYIIYRKKPKQRKFKSLATVPENISFYINEGLKDGAEYLYVISAFDKDKLSSILNTPVRANCKPVPSQPENLKASTLQSSVILKWEPNPEADIRCYQVFRKSAFKKVFIEETNATEITINDLMPGKSYSFVVKAIDEEDLESKFSQPVKIKI